MASPVHPPVKTKPPRRPIDLLTHATPHLLLLSLLSLLSLLLTSTAAALTIRIYRPLVLATALAFTTRLLPRLHHHLTTRHLPPRALIVRPTARLHIRSHLPHRADRTVPCARIHTFVPVTRAVHGRIFGPSAVETQHGVEAVGLGEPVCFAWGLSRAEASTLATAMTSELGVMEPDVALVELYRLSAAARLPVTCQAVLPATFPADSMLRVSHHTVAALRVVKLARFRYRMVGVVFPALFWTVYLVVVALMAVWFAPERRVALVQLYYDWFLWTGLGVLLVCTGVSILYWVLFNRPYGEYVWSFSATMLREVDVDAGMERIWDMRDARRIYIHREAVPGFKELKARLCHFWLAESSAATHSGRRFAVSFGTEDDVELCRLPSTADLTEGEATRLAGLIRERYPRLCMNEFAV